MMKNIETLISDKNLEANDYKYMHNHTAYKIFGKDDYRLVVEPLKEIRGYYKLYASFKTGEELQKNKLIDPLQLDLFYNGDKRG